MAKTNPGGARGLRGLAHPAGVIPGPVNPLVADDINIKAKIGDYILPPEVVSALGGPDQLDAMVVGIKKKLGLPGVVGPKMPMEPDSQGRMNAPGFADGGVVKKVKQFLLLVPPDPEPVKYVEPVKPPAPAQGLRSKILTPRPNINPLDRVGQVLQPKGYADGGAVWRSPYETDLKKLMKASPISNVVGLGVPALVQKGLGFVGNVGSAMVAPTDPMAMVKGRTQDVADQLGSTARNVVAPIAPAPRPAAVNITPGLNQNNLTHMSDGSVMTPERAVKLRAGLLPARAPRSVPRRGGGGRGLILEMPPTPTLSDYQPYKDPALGLINGVANPRPVQTDAPAAPNPNLVTIQDTNGVRTIDTGAGAPMGQLGFQPGEEVKILNGGLTRYAGSRTTSSYDPITGKTTLTAVPGTAATTSQAFDERAAELADAGKVRFITEQKTKAETAAQAAIPSHYAAQDKAALIHAAASQGQLGLGYAKLNADKGTEKARIAAEARLAAEKLKMEGPAYKAQAEIDAQRADLLGTSIPQVQAANAAGLTYKKKKSGFLGFGGTKEGFYDAQGKLVNLAGLSTAAPAPTGAVPLNKTIGGKPAYKLANGQIWTP